MRCKGFNLERLKSNKERGFPSPYYFDEKEGWAVSKLEQRRLKLDRLRTSTGHAFAAASHEFLAFPEHPVIFGGLIGVQ